MGGYMQPQGHFQVVTNTVDYIAKPTSNIRYAAMAMDKRESNSCRTRVSKLSRTKFSRKRTSIQITSDGGNLDSGQIIWRNAETGVLQGGTESRTDGAIAAW